MRHDLPARRSSRFRGPQHLHFAFRRFRLGIDCTTQALRLAFAREYAPLQAVPGKGATMECQRLIEDYERVLKWIRRRRPPLYFVAAIGCGHVWYWHRKGGAWQ